MYTFTVGCVYVRLYTASRNDDRLTDRVVIVPAQMTGNIDRVVVGLYQDEFNPEDQVQIRIGDSLHWVRRRDLCEEGGAPIEWEKKNLT